MNIHTLVLAATSWTAALATTICAQSDPCQPACKFPTFPAANQYVVTQSQSPLEAFLGADASVIYDSAAGLFLMTYTHGWNGETGIGTAVSVDGIHYTKLSIDPAPLLPAATGWDSGHRETSALLRRPNDLIMYYAGFPPVATTSGRKKWAVGLAALVNNDWAALSAPVLEGLDSTKWDWQDLLGGSGRTGPLEPSVILEDTGVYKMWYAAYGRFPGANPLCAPNGKDFEYRIGYATSLDGVNWTRGNAYQPVFAPDTSTTPTAWDSNIVSHVNVVKDATCGYHMFR